MIACGGDVLVCMLLIVFHAKLRQPCLSQWRSQAPFSKTSLPLLSFNQVLPFRLSGVVILSCISCNSNVKMGLNNTCILTFVKDLNLQIHGRFHNVLQITTNVTKPGTPVRHILPVISVIPDRRDRSCVTEHFSCYHFCCRPFENRKGLGAVFALQVKEEQA